MVLHTSLLWCFLSFPMGLPQFCYISNGWLHLDVFVVFSMALLVFPIISEYCNRSDSMS